MYKVKYILQNEIYFAKCNIYFELYFFVLRFDDKESR